MKERRKSTNKGVCHYLIILAAMVLGVLYIPAQVNAAVPETNTPYTMDVSYGFNDTAKGDRYLKVAVFLKNQGQTSFSGDIEILTTTSSLEVYRYDYPVSIEAGEETTEIHYIPLGIKAEQMFVSLVGPSGEQVLKKRVKLNVGSDITDSFMGVFSDRPERLEYMDQAGLHYGSIRISQVYLDNETAPDDPKGYDQLDLILVSDYDLNRLSDKQHMALNHWVENGGTLLIGGGERYRQTMGRFADEILKPPFQEPELTNVNLGEEYSQNVPQDEVMELICADLSLKNGSTLIQGDGLPLLSYTHKKKGRIVAAAFDLGDIGSFSAAHPAFLEKFLTLSLGQNRVDALAQAEYYGFSRLYFAVQGLINTGDTARLPGIFLYSAVIIVYLLLIGPGIYLCLKKRAIRRFYIPAVAACAIVFTGIIYMMGYNTRFKGPFFTYATIVNTSDGRSEEVTYINVRSPYNKPYAVQLNPEYTVRPVTKSYYYDAMNTIKFTGEENYKTNLKFRDDWTEIRVRDTVAFTPKLFLLEKQRQQTGQVGIEGSITVLGRSLEGKIVNHFEHRLEDAVLLLYGRAVYLGDLEPGQEVDLAEKEVMNYPLSYSFALAQQMTGADQFEQTDIDNPDYMQAQGRSRFLSFYLEESLSVGYTPEARVVAFSPDTDKQEFLYNGEFTTEGIKMVTAGIETDQEQDGMIYRTVLEQRPNVISGNYSFEYNSMYTGETAEPLILEYSLGNDLELLRLDFVTLSPSFINNPKYPYLSAFEGEMSFYNYNTGRNDAVEIKESYSAEELAPYLSPSNTITIKYSSQGSNEFGWERQLPMLYTVGREK